MLDKKDILIIEQLKQDSRKPIRDIAKITKIRPSTVHQRITKLKKDKVIEKFTVKLDDKAVNENFIVFMMIKTKPTAMLDSKILNNEHVKEVFGVTGEYDLLIKLKFRDVEEFNNYIISFRKIPNIISTLTMVVTTKIKEEL